MVANHRTEGILRINPTGHGVLTGSAVRTELRLTNRAESRCGGSEHPGFDEFDGRVVLFSVPNRSPEDVEGGICFEEQVSPIGAVCCECQARVQEDGAQDHYRSLPHDARHFWGNPPKFLYPLSCF